MIRFVLVASLLIGCRTSLETAPDASVGANGRGCTDDLNSSVCVAATTMNVSDLGCIQTNIFTPSCIFMGCHSSAADVGKLDLTSGKSHDALVGATSQLETTRKLVVPMDVKSSYLMLMLHDFDPTTATPPGREPGIGYMPLGFGSLCCQKLDAVERWITAGAPAN